MFNIKVAPSILDLFITNAPKFISTDLGLREFHALIYMYIASNISKPKIKARTIYFIEVIKDSTRINLNVAYWTVLLMMFMMMLMICTMYCMTLQ